MTSRVMTKFDSPVRAAIEEFARAGGALPVLKEQPLARPGAATTAKIGLSAAEFIPYGPPGEDGSATCEILATLGEIELEYAAIRRGVAVFDAPHRGTLIVTGKDRRDFLNRMLTQDLRGFPPGSVTRSFWLNRKGRIDADLTLAELGEEIIIDLDVTIAAATAESLSSFVFGEDVQVRDATSDFHRIQLHGPEGPALVENVLGANGGSAAASRFEGHGVTIFRNDITSSPGLHITVPRERAPGLWQAFITGGARPLGWYAFNTARIEVGTPLFNIDFGPTNLPHETALVDSRVSFKKGCYIGQEIVARMQNLGAPKQKLIGLRMLSDHLPVAGAAVFELVDGKPGDRIGVITSSTISPMCSAQSIAFAMLRTDFTNPGTQVLVHAEGEEARAEAHGLTFWTSEGGPQ